MTMKVLAVFTVLLVFVQVLQADAAEDECALPPRERTDCGYGGIGRDLCVSKGCCFDSSIPGVIWCYKNPKTLVPEVEEQGQEEVQPEQEVNPEPQTSEEQQVPETGGQEPVEIPQEQEEPQISEQNPETGGQEPVENPQEQEEPPSFEQIC